MERFVICRASPVPHQFNKRRCEDDVRDVTPIRSGRWEDDAHKARRALEELVCIKRDVGSRYAVVHFEHLMEHVREAESLRAEREQWKQSHASHIAEMDRAQTEIAAHEATIAALQKQAHEAEQNALAHAGRAADMEMARDNASAAAKMYSDAWRRELGEFVAPKSHLIDALVVGTRSLVAQYRDRSAEVEALRARLASTKEARDLLAKRCESLEVALRAELAQERKLRQKAEHQINDEAAIRKRLEERSVLDERRAERAERALKRAGFEDRGGAEWAPPLGTAYAPCKACYAPAVMVTEHGRPYCAEHAPTADVAVLSARDEFAKAAMQAAYVPTTSEATRLEAAQRAYAMADAMLKARDE